MEGENIGQVRLVEERIDFASSSETLGSRFELCSISTNATYKSVIKGKKLKSMVKNHFTSERIPPTAVPYEG